MTVLLESTGLTKLFGGLAALSNVDIALNQREIVGLIGPNGSGKTTFFNLVTGFLRPSAGRVRFKGVDITGRRPDTIAGRGIGRTFQLTKLFDELTVLQNVLIGGHLHSRVDYRKVFFSTQATPRSEVEKALAILDFVGLAHLRDELPKNLPHGHQRALDIAIAIASGPELLLLDEPLSGMNMNEIRNMLELVNKLRDTGTTILLVEHNMKAVMGTCDRIAVLNFGRKIAEGPPQEIAHHREVIEAYLGVEEDYGA